MPHKSMIGFTPFEALMGHNPNVSHLRVFGFKACVKIPIDKRKAFQAHSCRFILLGYVDDAKGYKIMESANQKCFIERSVQFEEDQVHDPHPTKEEEGMITQPFPFVYDDVLTNISNSEDEVQDDHDLDIEY